MKCVYLKMFRTLCYGQNIFSFQFAEFVLKISLDISFIKGFLIFVFADDFEFSNILVVPNAGKWSEMCAVMVPLSTFE